MDPFTIAMLAIGTNLAGSIIKSRAASQAAEYSAQSDEENARIAQYAAADAIARGGVAQERVRLQGTMVQGAQKTGYAASGVDTQSGSPVEVAANTGALNALDVLTVKSNAVREAWGFDTQASQFRRRAAVARATGQAQAAGEILGGAIGSAKYAAPFLSVSGQPVPDPWTATSFGSDIPGGT